MKILSMHELPQDLLRRRRDAQNTLDACDKEVSRLILEHAGLKEGDVLEEPSTGLRYKLESASGYINLSETSVILMGRRLYKTGRRAGRTARSASHISRYAEKVTT